MTDRYLVELGPVAAGQVPKDADYKYEHLVKGLRHVQIRVCMLLIPTINQTRDYTDCFIGVAT